MSERSDINRGCVMLGVMGRRRARARPQLGALTLALALAGPAAAASLLTAPRAAAASGFPDYDAAREEVVFGLAPGSAGTPVSGAPDYRRQVKVEGGLITVDPEAAEAKQSGFWLGKAPAAKIADGVVRFRVEQGTRADFGAMVRAIEHDPAIGLCGYEVSVDRDTLRLYRWDRGVVREMGEELKVRNLSRHATLEIVIYLVGPQLVATVYDGKTLKRLATLAAHDTTYARGRVGARVGPKQRAGGVSFISVMDRDRAPKTGAADLHGFGRLYGRGAHPDATPFGPDRYVFVRADDVASLERPFRGRVKATVAAKGGAQEAVLRLDPVELERLRRTGLRPLAVSGDVPWMTLNAAYRARRGEPPSTTRRGFRIDQSYKDPAMVEALLRGYQGRYPEIAALRELGRTHEGRPLWALKISDNAARDEDEPSVLFDGAHHASELMPIEYTLDVVQQLLEGYGQDRVITEWVNSLEIFVVPLVNPDGNSAFIERSHWFTRKNARDCNGDGVLDPFEGVDLNRNYPFGWGEVGSSERCASRRYRGASAGSEPETKAMMRLANGQHFAASISFHTVGTVIFWPYAVPSAAHPEPDVAEAVAATLIAGAPEQPNGRSYVQRHGKHPVSGGSHDWLLHSHGTIAFILEGSNHNPAMPVRNEAVAGTRPVWRALLDHVASGPRISGHVRDEHGRPLTAEVYVKEIKLTAGERWTTRARDGRFDRVLHTGGRYTIEASAPGYTTSSERVRVGGGPRSVELVLTRG